MADEPIDYSKEEERRYRFETSKQRAILYREWGYFALVVLVAAMAIWALYAFKSTQNVVGTANARLLSIADKLEAKVDAVDTTKINDLLAAGKDRIDGLKLIEDNLARSIVDLDYHTGIVMQSVAGRLRSLDAVLLSLRGATDEGARQIKYRGEDAGRAINVATETVGSLNTAIKDADTRLIRVMDAGALLIETANPRVMGLLDHTDKVIVSADGTIQEVTDATTELKGVLHNANVATADFAAWEHQKLLPEPPKTVLGRVWKGIQYVLQPTYDGLRFYFLVHRAGRP